MWKKLSASALAMSLAVSGLGLGHETSAAEKEATRGEYVKALITAMGVELGTGKTIKFDDVPEELKPYIEKAVELKLINGKSATKFDPNGKLNREQAFVIAVRGIGSEKSFPISNLKEFKDGNKISGSLRADLSKGVGMGFLLGYADKTVKPGHHMSKGEMRAIVQRFLKEYKASKANTTVALRILGTSDIHTNLVNYDYYKDTPSNNLGLAKTATLIKNARKENGNTLLFDNGDLIQGTPLGSFKASVEPLKDGEVHPSIAALNLLDYDVATLGNHEFNYGLPYLNEVMDDAGFPYVNANVKDAKTGKNMYTPYVIVDKKVKDSKGKETTIKVGVTGIVPPAILKWDKSHLEGKVTVEDSVDAVEALIPKMEKDGADVIVVLSHSGMGDMVHEKGEEDVSYLMTKVEGVDAIITGHAHQVFPGKVDPSLTGVDVQQGTINGKPVVMSGKFGSHLGVIDLTLAKKGKEWTVSSSKAEVRAIAKDDSDVDASVVEAVKAAHEGTIKYVRKAVGTTTAIIHSFFSQVQDDPSIQIVTNAQKWFVEKELAGTADANLPILSAGAPFKAGTRSDPEYYTYVPKGELAIKNVADLYLYDNTVSTLKLTGADVKEWLEMSAGQFNQIDATKTDEQSLINTNFRSYNFDVIDGVTYEIDVTQPAKYDADGKEINANASRIKNLQYDGKAIDPKQEFIVATNNYRANGTFPGVRNAKEVEMYTVENRQAVIDYILEKKTIDPSADGNWKFTTLPTSAKVTFESSKKAVEVIPTGGNISYLGEGTDGFGKYLLK
ncbi:bifunctional 2',3'-cyclic-nucleotide 2'-phosphodiesterase/3'-nucleotidase [Paenisporosarcina quisquiliarum]|uniref:Bifunctional 2',3'-cyclic-nucleotide 2'-phosphodiesterase/3'-nucleotidase n=1 Tax=Paenisporosarcina quisquiliarum TaxID=365346 RepID=A0A9X3LEM6_9BACL|nr:bifunctional 2',3'-cyclic-nucleotide 2'-phosphodiesterase/3'-nucleotidase [Paenisporosarcina quisquiliarum]MCZ8536633.1 bifunctional 2',3'-cyclic-nucleotide 2'-phosphodiesterase/3'-nucleotidase [Paenisporosarcina quisquiliarum]